MGKHILIVDDEPQFNVLLTEVYRQAGYGVTAVNSAMEGLAVLRRESMDLIVTDYRMPGMTGLEFIQEVRAKDPEIPVIMVSGYLDRGTVRELIAHGVGGVFSKPMNVFTLLNKTGELLGDGTPETDTKASQASPSAKEAPPGALQPESPRPARPVSPFWLFPGNSPLSEAFVRKAKGLTGFSRTLSVAGEEGTDFKRICDGFVRADRREAPPVYFGPEDLTPSAIGEAVRNRRAEGHARTTVVLCEADKLDGAQRESLYAFMENLDNGNAEADARLIFLLPKPLDALYDEGVVDEDFYVFLGANELVVPPLRAIRGDIELLAQDRLGEIAPGLVLEDSAVAFLRELPFERNEEDLAGILKDASRRCGGTRLAREHFETELERDTPESEPGRLERFLKRRRAEILGAAMMLSGGDAGRAAQWLKTTPDVFTKTRDGAAEGGGG